MVVDETEFCAATNPVKDKQIIYVPTQAPVVLPEPEPIVEEAPIVQVLSVPEITNITAPITTVAVIAPQV